MALAVQCVHWLGHLFIFDQIGIGNGPYVLGNGPQVLGNGPYVLGNGPYVLGNGPQVLGNDNGPIHRHYAKRHYAERPYAERHYAERHIAERHNPLDSGELFCLQISYNLDML